MRRQLWVGTYPEAGQGTETGLGEGIWSVDLDLATGSLTGARLDTVTPAASYIVEASGQYYAVNEESDGRITVLRNQAGRLQPVATARTDGAHPCHLLVNSELQAVVVSNYSSGSVSLHRLDEAGLPTGSEPHQVITFEGSGPRLDRQEGPHAHQVLATPGGSYLLVCDLGTDRIHRLRPDPASRSLVYEGVAATLPAGSGPRHAVFTGSHLQVVGELDGRLHTLTWDEQAGLAQHLGTTELSGPGGYPSHLSHSAGVLAGGSRGDDRIGLYSVDGRGLARAVRTLPLPGSWPRHHLMIQGWIVVALQHSNQVVCLDHHGRRHGVAAIPSPACVCPQSPLTV